MNQDAPVQAVSVGSLHGPTERRGARAGRDRGLSSLTVVAALVVVFVVLIATSWAFGLTVVRLTSGSMSPTFPTDSVLIVRSVPAAEVRVGDVVTVSRDGTVPITHRVTEVRPLSGGAQLVLRGDANNVDDPEPYQVSRVGLVLGGIPAGGAVLAALQSPLGLGLATAVVALLVLWAWWPRREPGAHVREP